MDPKMLPRRHLSINNRGGRNADSAEPRQPREPRDRRVCGLVAEAELSQPPAQNSSAAERGTIPLQDGDGLHEPSQTMSYCRRVAEDNSGASTLELVDEADREWPPRH